jgi:hypothetical protein
MRRWFVHILLFTAVLALPSPASAAIIGTFGWTYDAGLGTGSVFDVTNESAVTFESLSFALFAPGSSVEFMSMPLDPLDNDVAPGATRQSIADLSLFLVPDDIERVVLTFLFDGTTITTALHSNSLTGEIDLMSTATSIQGPDVSTPVPEPSTLALLACGIAAACARRRRRAPRLP